MWDSGLRPPHVTGQLSHLATAGTGVCKHCVRNRGGIDAPDTEAEHPRTVRGISGVEPLPA